MNSFGVTGKVGEAPESFRVEPITLELVVVHRNDTPNQISGSESAAHIPVQAVSLIPAIPSRLAGAGSEGKKKRGRPRKFGLYGSNIITLSPTPISASIPLTGDYSAFNCSTIRPMEPLKKKHKLEFENHGNY